ncbi:adenosylcobinamide-GDP ribazoletransferase [Alkaliphilus pronyensis]|uniref:Adenosylcobinamide-GDP ribazoletransferase n=1 Tax=Alkaliphilus pronyensis TaxID=1482732 RepID=A0A6I0F917_9FIRM|nr:adenosylcobinamide-GDP ribazoletransferase [Alkaliphilus pronyensis]KAB3532895.1 adenosylcobinamide-GDP ribazoletransferase [Alkaliphilus pronyensis]
MIRFIGVLQFLTRLTIIRDMPHQEDFDKGIIYFPIVGATIGLLLLFVFRVANVFFPHQLAIILTIGSFVVLTGGLHMDGLGDTFDGLYSNKSRARMLEIMKDSCLGTNGVLAIIFVLLIKITSLSSIGIWNVYGALVIMPVFGRLSLVLGSFNAKYARETGLGNIFIGRVEKKQVLISIIFTAIATIFQPVSIFFIPILWVFTYCFQRYCDKKIGGMTGDTLGALCEMVETLYLLYLLLIINIF